MCWNDKINYLVGHCTFNWIDEVNRIMSVRAVRLADDPPGYTDDYVNLEVHDGYLIGPTYANVWRIIKLCSRIHTNKLYLPSKRFGGVED